MARDAGTYGRFWDDWVERWEAIRGNRELEWPGDNWGSPEGWERRFRALFEPAGVRSWQRAVEIGPGSGKYTLKVLAASPAAAVRGYDVSERFLEICERRCGEAVENGRLSLHVLDVTRADWLLDDLTQHEWRGSVDGFYSIDSMVHVDLQYLIAYLLSAALVLRPGGTLVLTLADATTERGFERLLSDTAVYFPGQDPSQGAKFEWLSPDLVESLLDRLGFEPLVFSQDRDLLITARLRHPSRAAALEHYLRRTVSADPTFTRSPAH